MVNQWNRALVTGASAGIGRAIARQLAREHSDLVLVARSEERLVELAESLPVETEVLAADLATADGVATVAARLADDARPVDLLVNNAGFGLARPFAEADIEEDAAMVTLNVSALQRLSHAAAVAMVPRGRGGILNVSSVAAELPSPSSATYAATKAFVTSFSQSLHMELAAHGITVTCLSPGLTRTEFHSRAGEDTSRLPGFLWQEADEVAAAGLRALAEGKVVVVSGAQNRLATVLAKLAPGALVRQVTMRTAEVRHSD